MKILAIGLNELLAEILTLDIDNKVSFLEEHVVSGLEALRMCFLLPSV